LISVHSTPLGEIRVTIYDESDDYVGSAYTDYNGRYVVPTLVSGNYHVRTEDAQHLDYLDELYDNIPCFSQCNLGSGNLVSVTLNINWLVSRQSQQCGTHDETGVREMGSPAARRWNRCFEGFFFIADQSQRFVRNQSSF
jgi:hypothetical protein